MEADSVRNRPPFHTMASRCGHTAVRAPVPGSMPARVPHPRAPTAASRSLPGPMPARVPHPCGPTAVSPPRIQKKGETHPVSPEHKKTTGPQNPDPETNKQKRGDTSCLPQKNKRRRATLPHPIECSTITVQGLSYRVRKGTGRLTLAMTAAKPYPTHPPKEGSAVIGTVAVREPESGRKRSRHTVLLSHGCSVPSSANA